MGRIRSAELDGRRGLENIAAIRAQIAQRSMPATRIIFTICVDAAILGRGIELAIVRSRQRFRRTRRPIGHASGGSPRSDRAAQGRSTRAACEPARSMMAGSIRRRHWRDP